MWKYDESPTVLGFFPTIFRQTHLYGCGDFLKFQLPNVSELLNNQNLSQISLFIDDFPMKIQVSSLEPHSHHDISMIFPTFSWFE